MSGVQLIARTDVLMTGNFYRITENLFAMRRIFFLLAFFLLTFASRSQSVFDQVYNNVPGIPRGLLEAVSYQQTHIRHIPADEQEGCSGIPKVYGMMGLTLDGKNYFNENLRLVSKLSGIHKNDIIYDPYSNVLAYAKAFDLLFNETGSIPKIKSAAVNWKQVAEVLRQLSEIPDSGYVNQFALDCQLYGVFTFLNDAERAATYGFDVYNINLNDLFGADRYVILSAAKIAFTPTGITANGHTYPQAVSTRSVQYGPAIWNPAPSCNYSSRSGTAVSAITIHTIQGTYAGAISWSQNCASNVSFHYVIRSSDGQITQMVDETIKAWHVGSANPYTIGYEHEGYVTDASWYTNAMYTSSAALSRDVCASGYGINPLRTYYGASSSATDELGSCTKIKGHQHYPAQTHTDPGINWNWAYYYLLINNSTVPVTHTTSSGSFYDSGGPSANYSNDERKLYLFSPAGATSVSMTFTSFDLENNWDYMFIYDGSTTAAPLLGTYTGTTGPGTVTSTGGNLLVEFRSDCATVRPGWVATFNGGTTTPPASDMIAPTTSMSTASSWVNNDFTVNFTDQDNVGGSGVEKSFYQVIDFDGTDWRANAAHGFFSDNFDLATIHPDWTTVTGTWNITSGALTQTDESLSNTNIYAYLNHSLSNRYLYNWAGKMEGTGSNRRAGFHYFCDDPTLTNRGNGYFIWYRLDNDKVEIYKVTGDVFNLQADVPFNFNVGQWYDFKVMYDRITGKTQAYIDNVPVMTWTDASPYASGDYISFRSGNASWAVNNLKVYRSRAASVNVPVGPTGQLRYQNTDPLTPAGRIKTIINDNAGNLSSLIWQDINVDTTAPSPVMAVNDGMPADVDTWTSTNSVSAYWVSAFDSQSGIVRYWYALGTAPGLTDVVNWTDNSWYDSVTVTGLSLLVGETYYFTVKSENASGLQSTVFSSDGFTIVPPTSAPVADFYAGSTILCSGQCVNFSNVSLDASSFNWIFSGGDISTSTASDPTVCYVTSGNYPVTLVATGPGGSDTVQHTITVSIFEQPLAAFTVSSDTVYMPSAIVGFNNTSVNADGYYWDFGDGQTSTAASPWNMYSTTGVYGVSMIAANGPCTNDTAYITITVLNTTGITETGGDGWMVYPNPVTDQLNIITENKETCSLQLYDALGQLVFTSTFNGKSSINITGFSKGLYTLQIRSEKEVLFRRHLIKE